MQTVHYLLSAVILRLLIMHNAYLWQLSLTYVIDLGQFLNIPLSPLTLPINEESIFINPGIFFFTFASKKHQKPEERLILQVRAVFFLYPLICQSPFQ